MRTALTTLNVQPFPAAFAMAAELKVATPVLAVLTVDLAGRPVVLVREPHTPVTVTFATAAPLGFLTVTCSDVEWLVRMRECAGQRAGC